MKDIIIFPATVEVVTTRKDRTLRVTLGTQETNGETAGQLFALQNEIAFVAIKVEDFGQEEREMLDALKADEMEQGGKTLAQRLRHVLYRLWQQEPEGYMDSNSHYIAKMEKIIQHYKGKLQ